MRIVIAGGSGMLGRRLTSAWLAAGYEVVVLSRNPERSGRRLRNGVEVRRWAPPEVGDDLIEALRRADAAVNLAGESLGSRPWTDTRKASLLASRLGATGALVRAMAALPPLDRPKVLVSASGIDIYGDRRDGVCDEDTAITGHTVARSAVAAIAVAWEAEARRAGDLGIRVVLMRNAMVLAPEALAFRLLALPVRLFVGGRLGRGDQPFTWIHIDDAVGLYDLAVRNTEIRGPLNVVAPETPTQLEVARTMGRILHRPAVFPTPEFLLRLVLREEADLILHGRRAVPARALAAGYRFRYPELEPALREVLTARSSPDAIA